MIKRVLIYTFVFIAGIYLVRELLYIGIRKNRSGIFEKYDTVFLKENNYDVLFLGSSRVETHFAPAIFDSITGLNSYNIAVTGATPRIAYAVLKSYCSKSKIPSYLVYDVDVHFLKHGIDTIHHFPRYFPYLGNETLYQQFKHIDKRFRSFRYNPLHSLPYSNLRILGASVHGWTGKPGKYDTCFYKGFQKTLFFDSLNKFPLKRYYTWFHPLERQYLDSIIQFSKSNNIQLFLCTSPMYAGGAIEVVNKKEIDRQVFNIALVNKIPYKNFSQTSYSGDRSCFADYYHMTYKGARLFSGEFSNWFLQYSSKKAVN